MIFVCLFYVVKCRLAVLGDLQHVLSIRPTCEFANGIDRLKDRWDIIMSDMNYYPAVAMIDGDIVSTCMMTHYNV